MSRWTWVPWLAVVAAPAAAQSGPLPARCVVESVAQGVLHCRGGERVRLLMVDATSLQMGPLGRDVVGVLERLLPAGTPARLEFDARPRDRAGTLQAYAFTPDGRMVNEELARRGFSLGMVLQPNVRYAERILAAVDDAARARRGVWSAPEAALAAPRPPEPGAAPDPAEADSAAEPADSVAPDSVGIEVLEQQTRREGSLVVVEGTARNASSRPLRTVLVVATLRSFSGEPVAREAGLFAPTAVLPGQVLPFRVVARWEPAVAFVTLEFLDADGRPLPTRGLVPPPR